MRLIIHDLDKALNDKITNHFNKDGKQLQIVSDNGTIKSCIGCFGCWVKTPGKCILNDDYNEMGRLLSQTEELIIISKCQYGTYSPFIRNVLDRCLPYIHPDFTKRNGEIHHKSRYKNTIHTKAYFYEAQSPEEKETARLVVKANMVNFNGIVDSVEILENQEDIFNGSSIN